MKRTRKKHNAVIKSEGVVVAAVGGTGRSPSWRVSSAFIRTGSTTGRSSCWTGRRAFSKAAGAGAHVGKRSLEKRCPSDGGPRVRIHLPPPARCEPDFRGAGPGPRLPYARSGGE